MPIHARGVWEYAARVMHEDPDGARIVENRLAWLNSVKDYINQWGQWQWLEAWGTVSVAASGVLYFPEFVWEVTSMWPGGLGFRRPVDLIGGATYDRAGAPSSSGLSDFASRWGFYGVHADVSSAGVLDLVSSAGAADEGVEITVEGLSTDTYPTLQYETVTLDATGVGQTALSWPAGPDGVRRIAANYSSLFDAAGVALGQGVLAVTDAGGTSLEVLDMSRVLVHEHIRAELWPASTTTSFTYRYYRRIPDIISLDQVLDIPNEFKDVYLELLKGAIGEWQDGPAAKGPYMMLAEGMMRKMKFKQERQPGRQRGFRVASRYRSGRRRW